jgi:hypothetical protein
MATNRRILNLPLILSGNVTNSVVLPLDDPSDNLTKKINLGQIKNFVLSGLVDDNYYTTGTTLIDGIVYFNRNDILSAYTLNLTSLTGDANTYITATTYNELTNTITLTDNTNNSFIAYIDSVSGLTVNGILSATTISGGTLYGDGSNLTGIPTQDTFVSGGTYNTGGTITLSYNIGGGFQITGLTEDLNNEISSLAEADEQTITLNLITNKIELKESVSSPSGGTRTFQGNIIVNSGLTANSFIINNSYTPTSSGDTFGSIGQLTWDDDYLYVKTNNGWGRSILDYIF